MIEHELRQPIVAEMHLRRWHAVCPPSTIIQIVRIVDADERQAEAVTLTDMFKRMDIAFPSGARHISHQLSGQLSFTWEQHTEASSITLFGGDGLARCFDSAVPGDDPDQHARLWIEAMPGRVIRATRISIVASEQEAEHLLPAFDFLESDLVSCRIEGGVRIWSDFRLHADGYGRLLIAANGLSGNPLSRLVQRLQELGNYRNMALLGLPLAREQWKKLDQIEHDLRNLSFDVADPAASDDSLLESVTRLSMELGAIATDGGYRMNATAAYAVLVEERLSELAVTRIDGWMSLADFTKRRLQPAVRTCSTHKDRLAELSSRAADFTALLRARIETRIENQNGRLLSSMERRAAAQLQLQQLVEGLSVFALSYYCIGLLSYIIKGLETRFAIASPALILGIATPVVITSAWLIIHRLKHRMLSRLD